MTTLYAFSALTYDDKLIEFSTYQGQVVLVVNTASRCHYTEQYKGLQTLYEQFKAEGFVVLAFPCDQFAHQEPGKAADIHAFCDINYHVSFPLFDKIEVNGKNAHPLFQYLKQTAPGIWGTSTIKWNFTKFLIRRNGTVHKRYAPYIPPEKLMPDIDMLLQQ